MLRQDKKKKTSNKKKGDKKYLGDADDSFKGESPGEAEEERKLSSSTGALATRITARDMGTAINSLPSRSQPKDCGRKAACEAETPAKKRERKGSLDGGCLANGSLDEEPQFAKKDKRSEEQETRNKEKSKNKEKGDKKEKKEEEKSDQGQKKGGLLRELITSKKGGTMILRRTAKKKGTLINTSISTSDLRTLSSHFEDNIVMPRRSSPPDSPRKASALVLCSPSEEPKRPYEKKKERSNSDTKGDPVELVDVVPGSESSGSKPHKAKKKKKKSKVKAKQGKRSKNRGVGSDDETARSKPEVAIKTRRRSATVSTIAPAALAFQQDADGIELIPSSAPTTPKGSGRHLRSSSASLPGSESPRRTKRGEGATCELRPSAQGSCPMLTRKSPDHPLRTSSRSTTVSLLSSTSPNDEPKRSRNKTTSAVPVRTGSTLSPSRPALPVLRIPQQTRADPPFVTSRHAAALRPSLLQTTLSPLLSPRYSRTVSLSSPSSSSRKEGARRSQEITSPSKINAEGAYNDGGDVHFDQAVEEMIHSRWEEYENIRRLRGGSRRVNKRRTQKDTDAKLQTDANVFLGAIKEMVKMRTQLGDSIGEKYRDDFSSGAAKPRSRRRRETEMRIKRERKSRADRVKMRGSMTIEELRVMTNHLKNGEDGTRRMSCFIPSTTMSEFLEPPPSFPLPLADRPKRPFLVPLPPPLPPPAVVPAANSFSSQCRAMREEGKWGCNMFSIEHPIIYEDLFTLSSAQIENVAGLYRWRIENLSPVWISHLDEHHPLNHFYESDCYIVLYVGRTDEEEDVEDSPSKRESDIPDKDGALAYNLHYWIGRTASVDKKASVCIRAVQLNSYIGGKAKHYPEQQGEESPIFLSYFRKAPHRLSSSAAREDSREGQHSQGTADAPPIVYLEGGTECGLRRVKGVEPYERPRLYRFFMPDLADPEEEEEEDENADYLAMISGDQVSPERKKKRKKRNYPYFIQLVEPNVSSLNARDVFLLDTGGYQLYQWNGRRSRQRLTLVCNEILSMMNVIERKSLARVEVLTQGQTLLQRHSQFWQHLYQAQRGTASAPSEVGTASEESRRGEEQREPQQVTNERIQTLFQQLLDDGAKSKSHDGHVGNGGSTTNGGDVNHSERGETEEGDELALGGIKEILEVRGDYGSMDLHTLWAQGRRTLSRAAEVVEGESIKPSRKVFTSQGVYIIDCMSEIFVYCGRKSPPYSRQIAAFIANQMKEDDRNDAQSNRPVCCIIQEVREREEPVLFKARFSDWLDDESGKWGAKEKQAPRDFRSPHQRLLDEIRKRGQLKRPKPPEIDVSSLFPTATTVPTAPSAVRAPEAEPQPSPTNLDDDQLVETGSVEVGILLSGKTFHKLPEVEVGHFYSGECYVVLHTFVDKTKDLRRWVVYFWEGKNASSLRWPTFLLGLYPLLEEKIALSGGGIPESRRIYQGEETGEFTRMFRGTIVIRRGPRVPASEPVMEMFEAKVDPSDRFTRLVSVECSPRSLSSRGAYGLFLPTGKVFIWSGKHCSEQSTAALRRLIDTAAAALRGDGEGTGKGGKADAAAEGQGTVLGKADGKSMTRTLGQGGMSENDEWQINVSYVTEGAEPAEFWEALGSDRAPSHDSNAWQNLAITARLARFSYEEGQFCAAEVMRFNQRDLLEKCVYLLHPIAPVHALGEASASSVTGAHDDRLYIWIGGQATDSLIMASRHTTQRYAQHIAARGRQGPTTRSCDCSGETAVKESGTDDGNAHEQRSEVDERTEARCEIAELVEVTEGQEPAEFTRFFADWTRKVFVDPYEVRMKERRRLEEIERRELEKQKKAQAAAADGQAVDQVTRAEPLPPSPSSPKVYLKADEKRKKEREEFLRKLRDDRMRQDERRKQREKKEEEERRRRREKQELLRAKLKMLEQRVDRYYASGEGEGYTSAHDTGVAGSGVAVGPTVNPEAAADSKGDMKKRRDSMRAIGGLLFGSVSRARTNSLGRSRNSSMNRTESLPVIMKKESSHTAAKPPTEPDKVASHLALERLKERQEELLSRLKTRPRFLAYEPSNRRSSPSGVQLDGSGECDVVVETNASSSSSSSPDG